jgi:putative membrane protein
MMHVFGEHGWGMGWGWITGLAVLVLIVWLIVKITSQNGSQRQLGSKSALDILKERYARGEISKEEFKEKRNDIL